MYAGRAIMSATTETLFLYQRLWFRQTILFLPCGILGQRTAWLDLLPLSIPRTVCHSLLLLVESFSSLPSIHHALYHRGLGAQCYFRDRTALRRGHQPQELARFLPARKGLVSTHQYSVRESIREDLYIV